MDKSLENSNLRERMISVINVMVTSSRLRYVWLETQTGVQQEKWKKLCNRKQNPTAELIEALCCLFPNYAEWIATGRARSIQISIPDKLGAYKTLLWNTDYHRKIEEEAIKLDSQAMVAIENSKNECTTEEEQIKILKRFIE